MRIQFVLGTDVENTIDIEVAEVPTEEQAKAIEEDIYYRENLSLYDESRELLQFVSQLIEQMALTINCPSNWRSIGTELAEEYKDNAWIFDELELWNYEE